MKKTFFLIILTVFFLFSAKKTSAFDKNFAVSMSSVYQINENGLAKITQTVKIKNLSDFFYTPSYTLNLSLVGIKNVTAYNETGPLAVIVNQGKDGSSIEVDFKKITVGFNKINEFKVSFETPEIAKKHESVWEIDIPGISNLDDFTDYDILLDVPPDFGLPTIIKPEKTTQLNFFNKDEIGKSGVYIMYGNSQSYSLNLAYHLENKNLFPIKTEIALPPKTNYQEVLIQEISPNPTNVYVDHDGNWLATYNLSASQKQDVKVKVNLKVYPFPKKEELKNKNNYLETASYWEVNDPEIERLGKSLKNAANIYKYVVNNLSYNYNKIINQNQRQGARKALDTPGFSVCLEFTDLFVALARAAGIPARSVEGYAYTENSKLKPLSLIKDILHSWPEYYDENKETWIMIDPTWGNTTRGSDYFNSMDLNHIAFVINGIDSSYPVPAGDYKNNHDSKDVDVSFSPYDEEKDNVTINFLFNDFYLSGFPVNGNLAIKNNGNSLSQKFSLTILSEIDNKPFTFDIDPIPPFGSKIVKVNLGKTSFLTKKSFFVKASMPGKSFVKKINTGFLPKKEILLIGGGFLAVFIGAVSFAAKPWRLFIQK